MDRENRVFKKLTDWDIRLIDNCSQKFRIVGFDNYLDELIVSKYRDTIPLFISVNPKGKHKERLTLETMGYKDSKNKKAIEQFRVILSEKQAEKLYEDLGKMLSLTKSIESRFKDVIIYRDYDSLINELTKRKHDALSEIFTLCLTEDLIIKLINGQHLNDKGNNLESIKSKEVKQ